MPECDRETASALLDEIELQEGRGDTGYCQTVSAQVPIFYLDRIDKSGCARSVLIRRAIRLYFALYDIANPPQSKPSKRSAT